MKKVKKAIVLAAFIFAVSSATFAQGPGLGTDGVRVRLTAANYQQVLGPPAEEPTLFDRWYIAAKSYLFVVYL